MPRDVVTIRRRQGYFTLPAATAGYQGPGNLGGISTALFWGGLRAYYASYATPGTNPCMIIKDSSNNPTTINILSTGYADFATLNTAIANDAGTYLYKLCDQSGNGNDLTFNFGGSSSHFKTNALGTFTAIYWPDSATRVSNSANTITQNQPFSFAAVGLWEAAGSAEVCAIGSAVCIIGALSSDFGNHSIVSSPASSSGTWYSDIGVVNSTTSALRLNGNETVTGTTTGINNISGSGIQLGQGTVNSNLLRLMEFGFWGVGLTPQNRIDLENNARSAANGWNF
jgi:hypothetical protein